MESLVNNLHSAMAKAIGHGEFAMTTLSDFCRSVPIPRVMSFANDEAWRSTKCLFVLSTGRTGTSTLIRLLNLSPKVSALHEPKPNLVREYRRAYSGVTTRPDRYRRLFERARRRLISRECPNGEVYAEATLLKFFAPVIAEMLPNAKFLHLHRHPGEIVRSAMRRRWYLDNPLDRYRLVPLPTDPAHELWAHWDSFQKSCWLWHVENKYFLDLAETLGSDRVLRLQFDQWIDPRTGEYRRIFEFVGVELPEPGAVPRILGMKYNRQVDGEFSCFEQWTEAQKQSLCEIAATTMNRLGYAEFEEDARLVA